MRAGPVSRKALLKGTDAMDAAQQAHDVILALPNATKGSPRGRRNGGGQGCCYARTAAGRSDYNDHK